MLPILIMSALVTMITNLMMIASLLTMKKFNYDREINSPFECGFDPKSSSRVPFSLRFYLICIIFLIFDVEIVLLFPIISIIKLSDPMVWSMTVVFFVIILLLGLFHEWMHGALEWT